VAFNGWLILISLSVVATPIRALISFSEALPGFGLATWTQLTTPGNDGYHPWMSALLLGELALLMVQLSASVLLAVVYFQRRSSAPLLYVAVMWGSLLAGALDQYATRLIPVLAEHAEAPQTARWIGGGLMLALYTTYLLASPRARLSFTRRYRKTPAPASPETVPIIQA
jgi:hypothetical protein